MRPSKLIMFGMMSIFVWTWLVGLLAPRSWRKTPWRDLRAGLGLFQSRALRGPQTPMELSQT
jgi:hypothetical protein